jgi:hypothetical protein
MRRLKAVMLLLIANDGPLRRVHHIYTRGNSRGAFRLTSHEMMIALRAFDCDRALALLQKAVVEYQVANQLHDLVTQEKRVMVSEQRKVTDLQSRRPGRSLN